jgi:AcrR family transcriptional regulator
MSIPPTSLAERHAELTRRLILQAAVELLGLTPTGELTMRAVAGRAGVSERTLFRYFASHGELLDAVMHEFARRLDLPPEPTSVAALLAYPEALYARFEANAALTAGVLHSELYQRIRSAVAQRRGTAVRALVDRVAPAQAERERSFAAANIAYYLTATTWHYYRCYFGFSLADAVACAQLAISQALEGLGVRPEQAQARPAAARRSGDAKSRRV